MGQLRVINLDQRSDAWLAWRMTLMTASRSAAVIGECPHNTAYGVWCEMTGRKPGFSGNAATERGTEMENPAIATYEINKGFIETKPICLLHPTIDFIGASLDAICLDTMIPVEVKYPSEKSHALALAGEVPRHYWIQNQHQLMCVPDAQYLDYVSHRDDKQVIIPVQHDREFQFKLVASLTAFWDLVRSDVAPPLVDRDDKLVDDPDVVEICGRLIKLKEVDDKKAKDEMDALKIEVINLGGHPRVRCGGVLVTKSVAKSGKDSYRLTISKAEGI